MDQTLTHLAKLQRYSVNGTFLFWSDFLAFKLRVLIVPVYVRQVLNMLPRLSAFNLLGIPFVISLFWQTLEIPGIKGPSLRLP